MTAKVRIAPVEQWCEHARRSEPLQVCEKLVGIEIEIYPAQMGSDEREKWRSRAISALGGKCAKCDLSDYRALEIDHVLGGGLKEKKLFGMNTVKYYKHVVSQVHTGRYQLLCANDNRIKEWERKRASRIPDRIRH